MIPVPMLEPTLPPADQSLLHSDQENIPPRMVTPPPLNVLVPVEEEIRVKECCQRTLAVRNQHAVRGKGAITKPYYPSGRKQLASVMCPQSWRGSPASLQLSQSPYSCPFFALPSQCLRNALP